MIIKTSNITFNREEIEKATNKREPSSFWPITRNIKSDSKKQIGYTEPKREDINITGSVLRSDD